MEILKFDTQKENLTNQYALSDFSKSNGIDSEILFKKITEIYNAESSKQIGKGKAIKYFFENVKLCINPSDIFSDLLDYHKSPRNLTVERINTYKELDSEIEKAKEMGAFFANCDFGHTMPDWEFIMAHGITGVLELCNDYLEDKSLTKKQIDFYMSVKISYEGILVYIKRLYELTTTIDSPNTKFASKNLMALLHGAPQTFGEAAQLYFIYYAAQHFVEGENLRSLGAIDDILYPFYLNDIKHGRDINEIRQIIRYFFYKWTSMDTLANIPFNLCSNVNELTYLLLEEYVEMDIMDPKIHIKCTNDIPERIYDIVMKSIRKGNNSFVFINDKLAINMLEKIGQSRRDAEKYTIIGCYEPASAGKEIPCTCNGGINMPMAVEVVLNSENNYVTFEELYNAVKEQLKIWIKMAMYDINNIEQKYPLIHQAPILSSTFFDCMKKGVDAYEGGAKYNNSSICTFGIATLVDELTAIKKGVFVDKILTLDELKKVLKSNWNGSLNIRKKLIDYPKFGNNISEADEMAKDIINFVAAQINNKPNGRNGVYRLGLFSIDWRMEYGKKLGASADGRFAGEPVSKNMCASVGMDKKGVTALINSITKFDYSIIPNGTVLDLTLHPSAISGDEGIEVMKNLLKIYLKKGGFALQINALDAETLKKAQLNPKNYKNLQVRLCGWNVYFLDLDLDSQNDLIRSMECE